MRYTRDHLTPTELAYECGMSRAEVIRKCVALGVPIVQGRIDKAMFMDVLSKQEATDDA